MPKTRKHRTELEQLIHEQEQELKLGNFQPWESFVTMSLDMKAGHDNSLTQYDFEHVGYRAGTERRKTGCVIHGFLDWRQRKDGKVFCGQCNKDRMTERRRGMGVKPRNWCEHGPDDKRVTPGGTSYCRPCKIKYMREWHARTKGTPQDRT